MSDEVSIDAIGKALYVGSNLNGTVLGNWTKESITVRTVFRTGARHAVEAMRVPSRAMLTAAWKAAYGLPCEGEEQASALLRDVLWPAMIAELLKETV